MADVRRFPTSKKHPHFSRENLGPALKEAGIEYVFLGEELGGYRRGGYEAYTETEGFRRGLGRLEELAVQGKTAIMCAERDPRGCHRRYIAAALAARMHKCCTSASATNWRPKTRDPPPSDARWIAGSPSIGLAGLKR